MDKERLLVFMTLLDETIRDAVVYCGEKEVSAAFLAFSAEYGRFVDDRLRDGDEYDDEWDVQNNFMVLVDTKSREVYGIRDYGRYSMKPSDFFMRSDYLPVFMNPGNPVFDRKQIELVLSLYGDMIKEIEAEVKESGKSPLVLVRSLFENEYLAWDIDNMKEVIVSGYKDYRDAFAVIEISSKQTIESDDYFVYAPSDSLIKEANLDLEPFVWKHKMAFDKWEERKTEAPDDIVDGIKDKDLKGIYLRGVDLVNKGRMMDLGSDAEFVKLETRVERFARLIKLGGPDKVIRDEAELIKKAVVNIEGTIPITRFTIE